MKGVKRDWGVDEEQKYGEDGELTRRKVEEEGN